MQDISESSDKSIFQCAVHDQSVLSATCGGSTPSFQLSLVCPPVSATAFLTFLQWPGGRGASGQKQSQAHLPGEQESAANCCGLGSGSNTPISTRSSNFLSVFLPYPLPGVISSWPASLSFWGAQSLRRVLQNTLGYPGSIQNFP